ncbi:MAG TPA: Wzz/FepE/Etk N-terminal domain-containing protein [Methylomirabilota bacterium]|jgi:polysaccharide chain length determinant protein (PEP-CTERM system associated)
MATPMTPHEDSARGAGLGTILEIVRRRRMLALLPFVFVLAAAASLAFFLPSLWTARATVLVNRQEIPEAFVKSTVNTDVDARLLTLSHDVLDTPRLSKIIQENNLYPSLRRSKPMPDVVERMRKDIAIDVQEPKERRGRESSSLVFTVAYTTTDPVVAARVTNTLASLFSEENSRQREQQAQGTSEFLEAQLRELRTKLAGQEQKITAYKEQHLGELPEQKEVNLRTLERLQQQLSLAYENNRRATERRQNISQSMNNLDLASAMAGSPTASVVGPTVTPAETAAARVSILKQELAALQTTYSDKYPDVIQMKEQIRIMERRVAEEEKKAAASASPKSGKAEMSRNSRDMQLAVQNPYVLSLMQQRDQADVEAKASNEEIAGLTRQIATYQRRLEMTPKREQELALITRDYETTRDMFRTLLAKRGEADIAAELEQRQKGERFRVIDQARLPERPAGPNRLRLLIVGLVLAFGAAGVAVVLAEQVDTSYRRAEEVRATAGVPVLSTIPRIVTEDDRIHAARQRRMALCAVAVGLLVVVGTSFMVAYNNQSLVSLLTPDATAAAKR